MITMENRKRSSIFFIITLPSLAVLLVLVVGLLSTNFGHIQIRWHFYRLWTNEAVPYTHCLMYDKAPRTGSSTILNSLRNCWKQQGYKFHRKANYGVREGNSTYVQNSLSVRGHQRILIGGDHFLISHEDVVLIAKSCVNLFYVTSTRPMKERILSKAKYEVSGGRIWRNTTVSGFERQHALKKIFSDEKRLHTEERLEYYPFYSYHIPILPDYVVRADSLISDLRKLLEAFQCGSKIHSKNVHRYNISDDGIIKAFNLTNSNSTNSSNNEDTVQKIDKVYDDNNDGEHDDQSEEDDDDTAEDMNETELERIAEEHDLARVHLHYGDKRHKKMMSWAKRYNKRGLEKAQTFV